MLPHTLNFYRCAVVAVAILNGFSVLDAIGQTSLAINKPGSINTIPPSPEAAALGRYGEQPVNTYTGLPSISIPLLSVTCGELTVPVSISYNASGNKVEEIAPWTGLGWTLNAGGIITRVVRGQPDDGYGSSVPYIKGFLTYTRSQPDPQAIVSNDALKEEVAMGCADTEPDQFFFNFDGYSGQFGFDWQGRLIQSADKHIAIQPIFLPDGRIRAWVVRTERGTIYRFASTETTRQNYPAGGRKNCRPALGSSHTSGWYLTSITDLNQRDSIVFAYESYQIKYNKRLTETVRYQTNQLFEDGSPSTGYDGCVDGEGPREASSNSSELLHFGVRVHSITSSDNISRVEFVNGRDRTDLAGTDPTGNLNLKALAAVVLQGPAGPVRRFDLGYSPTDRTGRLTLETVQESNGGISKPPYRFSYSPLVLPPLDSKDQDHWGYFNEANNLKLLPTFEVINTNNNTATTYRGANRDVNPAKNQAGMLHAIVYPTGGRTEFDFETNEYSYTQEGELNQLVKIERDFTAAVGCDTTSQVTGLTKTVTITTPFRVQRTGNESQQVVATYSWDMLNVEHATSNTKPLVQILDSTKQVLKSLMATYNNHDKGSAGIALNSGQYYLVARSTYTDTPNIPGGDCSNAAITIAFKEQGPPLYKKLGGGLRLRAMRDYPNSDTTTYQIKRYTYAVPNDPRRSSGVIYQEPIYAYYTHIWQEFVVQTRDGPVKFSSKCPCIMHLAQSRTGLGTTQGNYVGYGTVTVTEGRRNALKGKTVFGYTTPVLYPDNIRTAFPFTPTESHAYATGQLREQVSYVFTDQRFLPVSRDTLIYRDDAVWGLGLSVNHRGDMWVKDLYRPDYVYAFYTTAVGHTQLDSVVHTAYSTQTGLTGIVQQKSTKNFYDALGKNLVQKRDYLHNGTRLLTTYSYAHDYRLPSPEITELVRRNVLGIPLEIITLRASPSLPLTVLSGAYTRYGLRGGQLHPTSEASLEVRRPLAWTGEFAPSIYASQGGADPTFRTQLQYEQRDLSGNVVQVRKPNALPTTYVWGYARTQPVAEVQNASYAEILAVLGQATIDQLAALNPGTEAQVRQLLEPLRTRLPQARVTTYTYAPLVGMTSKTDPSGRTIFYEYDALGRLLRVRDEQGRMLTEQEYKYARP